MLQELIKSVPIRREETGLLLKLNQRISFVDIKHGTRYEAVIQQLHRDSVIAVLDEGASCVLNNGSEVQVEVAQREDALYVYRGSFFLVSREPRIVCHLLRLSGINRVQRRSSERMPVKIKAEYMHLLDEHVDRPFYRGIILNISKTGVLLAVEHPVEIESDLFLSFKIGFSKIKEMPLGLVGRVVRGHNSLPPKTGSRWKYCYGVQFKKYTPVNQKNANKGGIKLCKQ